jgi:hypothetical protein
MYTKNTKLTSEQIVDQIQSDPLPIDVVFLLSELHTKSAVIRKLHADGMKRTEIAKIMHIRYQHVRNVLVQPLKRSEIL